MNGLLRAGRLTPEVPDVRSKVCILLPHHWGAARGGAEFQAHILAQMLARDSRFDVTYLARYVPDDRETYEYPIESFCGPVLPGGLRWGRTPDAVALFRALKRIKPDIIIQMVACAYTGVAAFYARNHEAYFYWYVASDMDIERIPNVGVRGVAQFFDRLLFRYGATHADFIVAQTALQAARMRQSLRRCATLQIGNFLPGPEKIAPKPERFTIAWIANIKVLKRPDLFVALARHFSRDTRVRFRMAGRITDRDVYLGIADALGELDNLEYLGELALEQVEAELSQTHLFINTSDYEGFPNTFIQAWLQGVPVFSLHVDPDGIMAAQGMGCQTGSFEALVLAVQQAIANPESIREMGARARDYALKYHSLKNVEPLLQHMQVLSERRLGGFREREQSGRH